MLNTHTHTHTVSPVTQGGLSLRQGLDAILTHVGVPPLTKLLGYEHREDALGGGGAGNGKHTQTHTNTHTHTQTHTVSPVIHIVDCASGNDRKQS